MKIRALVVGGTDGVAQIVAGLARGGWEVTAVAPGDITVAHAKVIPRYTGGAVGLAKIIVEAGIEVIVDAAAAFDSELHAEVAEAARATGVELVGYSPPSVVPEFGADGQLSVVSSSAEAAREAARADHVLVDCAGGVVAPDDFAADAQSLYVFRRAPARARRWPRRNRDIVPAGTDPATEEKVLIGNQIDCVVVPDTGEQAVQATLKQARRLQLFQVVVARPQTFDPGVRVFGLPAQVVHAV